MVLQTSEIADTPPTRRSRAARVPPDGLAGPIRVLGIGGGATEVMNDLLAKLLGLDG